MFSDHECFCRTKGFNCDQGRKCPVRHAAANDEISERVYYTSFALRIAIGAVFLWILLDPMGVLALIEGLMS